MVFPLAPNKTAVSVVKDASKCCAPVKVDMSERCGYIEVRATHEEEKHDETHWHSRV